MAVDHQVRQMMRELSRALARAIRTSADVSEVIRKIRHQGHSPHLVLSCQRGALTELPPAADPGAAEASLVVAGEPAAAEPVAGEPAFRINGRDVALLKSMGIDPTRRGRGSRGRRGRGRRRSGLCMHRRRRPSMTKFEPLTFRPPAAPEPAAPEPAAPPPAAPPGGLRPSLLGLPLRRLAEVLAPVVDRPYRAAQIYRALYQQGVRDFAAMTDLSQALRRRLDRHFSIDLPAVADCRRSADGTAKVLFRLADGATIETVEIPDGERRTLCLSSQAGCALACRFCVTGYWGGGRNLTAGEIVAQVLALWGAERPGLNLVFMGMGEPLLNLDAVAAALDILLEQISWRRVTVSTAGVIPGIEEMAGWSRRPRLAISLHAPDDDRRSEIMPINRRFPLADLLAALARYPLHPKERLTFEYILIRGFNDALADADALAALLRGLRAKVNLIPLNPDPVLGEAMRAPAPGRVDAFRQRLLDRGLVATTRRRRGDDVAAACGQLRAPGRAPRGFRRSNLSF